MKKLMIFLVCICLQQSLNAQYTLTSQNNPAPGEITIYKYDSKGLTIPQSGQNQVWDYSNTQLTFEFAFTNTFVAPTSVLHYTAFPQMTIGRKTGATNYEAYYTDGNKYQYLGWSAYATPCTYSAPALVMSYPMSYGTYTSQPFGYNYANLKGTGNIELSGIGTGTLLTPGYTFTNVLLVKRSETRNVYQNASSNFSSLMFLTHYEFYCSLSSEPVFKIRTYIQPDYPSSADTSIFIPVDFLPVGIKKTEAKDPMSFNVFPNPTQKDQITLQIPSPGESLHYYIVDLIGKKVIQNKLSSLPEETLTKQVDISGLKPGVYYITVENQTIKSTRKLIVR